MSVASPDASSSDADPRRLRLRQAQQLLLRGVDQHQAGQLTAALADYRRALGLDPENADALHLTGVALLQGGDNAAAACWLAAATLARPGFATAWSNLGNALRATGQGERAVACYRRALRLTPDFPDALNNLGSALLAQNQPSVAIPCLIDALRLAPGLMEAGQNLADALKMQGAALAQAGDAAAAIGCYRRALALRPTDLAAVNQMVATLNNLGVALRERGRLDDAAACYEDILRLAPGVTETRYNLALIRLRQDRRDEAERLLGEVLRQRPDANDARLALAGSLTARGRPAAATAGLYAVALCYEPGEATALNALGLARQGENRLGPALAHWRRALRLSPDDPAILCNMGLGLHDSGDPAAAAGYFDRAVALDPDHVAARWNGAVNRLLLGDYPNGWREYEWRWRLAEAGGRIGEAIAPWDGGDAGGRTVLLECEQGLGDCLHFIRYAPLVRARNARVAMLCPPALRRIFASVAGIDNLGCRLDELPPCDVRAPLLSLPRLLGTTLATVPAAIPYLDVEPERAAHWRDRLAHAGAHGRGRRIGLVWRGGGGYRNDANRSMPAALLAGLLDIPGVWGVSLQKDAPAEETGFFAGRDNFTDLSRELADFADTAAVIRQLDLVVSVDTSVLHLAGGLGAPAWGLLPFVPDWRWGRDGATSPWYPAIRLFRQPARGDWGGVVAAVAAALAAGE